ncbi:MarR family winged helix-turn-helix transcriptional regulator [Bacillus amyloliquefaciens]|uniref:MarR family winged helix-turn-helix transcriptional regulator n=1 Tax=Bacillus amyloliquefaciens TaxID=1390 RepID=UPI0008259261|nr:MarR family transcriptional regulator [Bacillus amyloliquefaciens]AOC92831.1 putative HTH-type transcriptional regulator YwhA [Bacillus amyloliquefaciens]RDY90492.1 MarR family transcriptional regulator [Bacillus amyloliquefaciens]
MKHDNLQANVLDYALTKYLKSTKKLDEATIPKSINNIRGFILRIIYRHGTCTIKDILQEVTLSPSATTTALNNLEKEGFVERSRNNEDRRTVWMTLSESGKMAAMQMIENRQLLIDELFEALTEEEKKTFFSLVEKVVK